MKQFIEVHIWNRKRAETTFEDDDIAFETVVRTNVDGCPKLLSPKVGWKYFGTWGSERIFEVAGNSVKYGGEQFEQQIVSMADNQYRSQQFGQLRIRGWFKKDIFINGELAGKFTTSYGVASFFRSIFVSFRHPKRLGPVVRISFDQNVLPPQLAFALLAVIGVSASE